MNKFSASSFIQLHLQHRKSWKTLLYLIHSKAKKLKVYLQVYKKNNIGITQGPQYWVRLRKKMAENTSSSLEGRSLLLPILLLKSQIDQSEQMRNAGLGQNNRKWSRE